MGTAAQELMDRGEAIGIEKGKAIGIEKGKAIGIEKGKAIGIEKGKAEGRAEGRAEALARLLEQRFGAMPESDRARVEGASTDEIDLWLTRIFAATSLADVFAPEH